MKVIKSLLYFLFVFIVVGIITLYLYFDKAVNTKFKAFSGEKIIVIDRGSSVSRVANILEREGIIKNSDIFKLAYKFYFRGKVINAGEFKFDKPLSIKEVLQKLISEYGILISFTIKEGDSIFDIGENLEKRAIFKKDDFLKFVKENTYFIADLAPNAKSLEGFLFPDTYKFSKGIDIRKLVSIFVENFRTKFFPVWNKRPSDYKFSIYETITLASLIEKETSTGSERSLISSVFHNRLKKGMLLQCDPTFIYALKVDGKWKGKIGYREIKYDSPYNTYLYRGLPPGPIANPGISSIKAAIYPANTKYLYFVSKNDGTHYFSKTLKEHNRAVYNYQIRKVR